MFYIVFSRRLKAIKREVRAEEKRRQEKANHKQEVQERFKNKPKRLGSLKYPSLLLILVMNYLFDIHYEIKLLWPNRAIWRHKSGSTFTQVMTCSLTVPSHYLNPCWLTFKGLLLHSPERSFTKSAYALHCMCLDITFLKLLPHLPGAKMLNICTTRNLPCIELWPSTCICCCILKPAAQNVFF